MWHKTYYAQQICSKLQLKIAETVSFTVIRKYSQQLIINADKQGAKRELIFEQTNSRSLNYGLDILVIALITTSL